MYFLKFSTIVLPIKRFELILQILKRVIKFQGYLIDI